MHGRQAAEQQMHTYKIKHYTNWYLNEYIHPIITKIMHIYCFLSSNYVEFVVKSGQWLFWSLCQVNLNQHYYEIDDIKM